MVYFICKMFAVGNANELALSSGYGWCHLIAAAAPRFGGNLHAVPDDVLASHRRVFVASPVAREAALQVRTILRNWGAQIVVPDIAEMDVRKPPPGFGDTVALARVDPASKIAGTWLHVHSMFQLVMGAGFVPTDVQLMNVWLVRAPERKKGTVKELYDQVLEYCSASYTLEWYTRAAPSEVTYEPLGFRMIAKARAASAGGTHVTLRMSANQAGVAAFEGGTYRPSGFSAAHYLCNALLNGLNATVTFEVIRDDETLLKGGVRNMVGYIEAGTLVATCIVDDGVLDGEMTEETARLRITSTLAFGTFSAF